MEFLTFTAGSGDNSRRLDKVLKVIFKDSQGVGIHQALRKKLITLNGKKSDGSDKVCEGDKISIAAFLLEGAEKKSVDAKTENTEHDSSEKDRPEVVFSNKHILVINKPRGISVQSSSPGEKSLAGIVSSLYRGEGDSSLSFRTAPLHRLDRNTTGLLAFSQSILGAHWFSENIKIHTIKKNYVGIIQGRLSRTEEWHDCIDTSPSETGGGFKTVRIAKGFTEAVTTARPLAYGTYRGNDVTLSQFDILTGKKHQIRCQSSHHGHPLLGDSAYGGRKLFLDDGSASFFLHASRLSFPKDNPLGLPDELTAPLPAEFEKFISFSLINWDGQLII